MSPPAGRLAFSEVWQIDASNMTFVVYEWFNICPMILRTRQSDKESWDTIPLFHMVANPGKHFTLLDG
jgi:hypothetical protein